MERIDAAFVVVVDAVVVALGIYSIWMVNCRQSMSTSNSHHLIIAARFRIIRRWCSLSVPTNVLHVWCAYVWIYIIHVAAGVLRCSYHSCACMFAPRATVCISICCRRRRYRCMHSSITRESAPKSELVARTRQLNSSTMRILLNFYSMKLYRIHSTPRDGHAVPTNGNRTHLINNNIFVKCHFSHLLFAIPA